MMAVTNLLRGSTSRSFTTSHVIVRAAITNDEKRHPASCTIFIYILVLRFITLHCFLDASGPAYGLLQHCAYHVARRLVTGFLPMIWWVSHKARRQRTFTITRLCSIYGHIITFRIYLKVRWALIYFAAVFYRAVVVRYFAGAHTAIKRKYFILQYHTQIREAYNRWK